MTDTPCAVVDVTEMPYDAQCAAFEACEQSGVEAVRWNRDRGPEVAPSVLLAALPAGARRIPEPIMDLIGRTAPSPPLVLLCEDPLVSPTFGLHDGRVMLVAKPFTTARLFSQIRMVLAGAEVACATVATRPSGDAVVAHERLASHAWLGGVLIGDQAPPPSRSDERGTTALLPVADDPADLATRVETAHEIVTSSATDGEKRRALEELLGDRVALVHLGERGRRWVCYWPSSAAPLVLFSEHRLPSTCNLERRSGLVSLEARSGDLLVALSAGAGAWLGPLERTAIASGGPALIRALAHSAAAVDGRGSGLAVEVRW